MKHQFVPTSNYRRFIEAVKRLESRGATEASLMLVSGAPGRGKTNVTDGWASQTGALHLRANQGWTPNGFLRALAETLSVEARGASDIVFQRLLLALGAYKINGKPAPFPPLVVDEIQHCLHNNAAVLERIRDFSDRTGSIVVLVAGEDEVLRRIKKFPQISSRIGENVEFQLASVDDIALICKQLAEVEIKPDLVGAIHKEAGGVLRLVMNAIASVEEVAKNSGIKAIAAAQFKESGATLCIDWQGVRTLRKVA